MLNVTNRASKLANVNHFYSVKKSITICVGSKVKENRCSLLKEIIAITIDSPKFVIVRII